MSEYVAPAANLSDRDVLLLIDQKLWTLPIRGQANVKETIAWHAKAASECETMVINCPSLSLETWRLKSLHYSTLQESATV
jgi:hypothetical protein